MLSVFGGGPLNKSTLYGGVGWGGASGCGNKLAALRKVQSRCVPRTSLCEVPVTGAAFRVPHVTPPGRILSTIIIRHRLLDINSAFSETGGVNKRRDTFSISFTEFALTLCQNPLFFFFVFLTDPEKFAGEVFSSGTESLRHTAQIRVPQRD